MASEVKRLLAEKSDGSSYLDEESPGASLRSRGNWCGFNILIHVVLVVSYTVVSVLIVQSYTSKLTTSLHRESYPTSQRAALSFTINRCQKRLPDCHSSTNPRHILISKPVLSPGLRVQRSTKHGTISWSRSLFACPQTSLATAIRRL